MTRIFVNSSGGQFDPSVKEDYLELSMPRKSTSSTRLRLVEAAADLIWRKSYTAAGVEDLCQLAAARKGSFYHFFPTKSDLAVAAIAHRWEIQRRDVYDPLDQTGEAGLSRITRLVERLATLSAAGQPMLGSPFAGLGQEMAHQDDRIRAAIHTVFEEQSRYLRRWLDEAAEVRQIAAGDNGLRARQVLALLEGSFLLAKVAGDPELVAPLCTAMAAVAGRTPSPVRPPAGTPPELL